MINSIENPPWDNKLFYGVLWCLQQFPEITIRQMFESIGKWKISSFEDEIRRIVQNSYLTFFIDIQYNEKGIKVYSLDRQFKFLPIDALAAIARKMYNREIRFDLIKKFQDSKTKPTKPELKIKHTLTELQSNFIFNDYHNNKTKIKIGSRFPDFIDINKKLIIEHFGDYYHRYIFRSLHGDILSDQEHETERIHYFSDYGYKTLIIWENEVKDSNFLKEKILNFIGNLT